jgi:hypothetical protein
MGDKNARADQTQNRCHCLDHAILPSRPRRDKTTAALHSQKIQSRQTRSEEVRFCRNTLSVSDRNARISTEVWQPIIHHAGAPPFPPPSRCVIVTIGCGGGPHPTWLFGGRYPGTQPGGSSLRAWGSGGQIRFSAARGAAAASYASCWPTARARQIRQTRRSQIRVSSSPRVVALGDTVPKGGGIYRVGKPYTVAGGSMFPKKIRTTAPRAWPPGMATISMAGYRQWRGLT